MILMIDNYDSFTYNIVQYLLELGADVVVHRNDEIDLDGITALKPEKIVISPGPCTPNEAGISMPCIEHFAGTIPILGICLGHQSIGQVFGGQVVRAKEVMHGKTSPIHHNAAGVFRNLAGPFTASLSFISRRAKFLARMFGSYRLDRSRRTDRRNHGLTPSRVSR